MLLASSQRLECTDVDKHWKGAGDVLCSHATYLKWASLYLSASLDVQVCLALLPCTETAASTREGGDCYAAAAEWGKPAWYWQLNLFTVVQEVSPWDMGFFMDILVRMDYFITVQCCLLALERWTNVLRIPLLILVIYGCWAVTSLLLWEDESLRWHLFKRICL